MHVFFIFKEKLQVQLRNLEEGKTWSECVFFLFLGNSCRTVWVVSCLRSVRLQDSSHNGVGPEALCGTVLGLHLLCFGSWVRVTGIQHRLEDTPTSIDEPARKRQGWGKRGRGWFRVSKQAQRYLYSSFHPRWKHNVLHRAWSNTESTATKTMWIEYKMNKLT